MLTDQQSSQIKEHLLKQLVNFPEDQRENIKNKITEMTNEQLEKFIEENNLKKNEEIEKKDKCIFCSIVKKEISSYSLLENENYIAILEINPLSKGHTLIIPKKHINIESLNDDALELAKEISQTILAKLSPQDIEITKNEILGHAILEIIPIYENEKQERKKIEKEKLEELKNILIYNTSKQETEKQPEPPKQELPKIKSRLKWI